MTFKGKYYSKLFQDKQYLEFTRRQLFKNTEYFRQFSNFLSLNTNDTICDLGCGTGFLDFELIDKFPTIKIFALDNDQDYIEYANKKLNSTILSRLSFKNHDLNNPLPFTSNSFDVVYSFGAMHMVKNYPRTISDCYNVLKKNGHIILFLPIDECPQSISESDIVPNRSVIDDLESNLFKDYYSYITEYTKKNSGLDWSSAPDILLKSQFENVKINGMFTPFNPIDDSESYPAYLEMMKSIEISKAKYVNQEFNNGMNKNELINLVKNYEIKYDWLLNEFKQKRFNNTWGGAPLLIITGEKK